MRSLALIAGAALVLSACSSAPQDQADPDQTQQETRGFEGTASGVKLRRMATLSTPIAMAVRPGDTRGYYVAERAGRVKRLVGSRVKGVTLDIRKKVGTAGEGGLLGIAFSPNGGRLYVNYTDNSGDTRVAWYKMRSNKARLGTRVELLKINQPYSNHNGGDIHIGPDGNLYIATGDGGGQGDPQNNGQDKTTLLGKILRIDPRGNPYRNVSTNPFIGNPNGRNQILHYGLRNPWRFSIDSASKMMWIADVGQNTWEEINRVPLSKVGANLGWARMEGRHSYNGRTEPSNHHRPIYEYSHAGGRCSVTGGVVLRDPRMSNYKGRYLFSDFCDGTIRYLRKTSNGWRAGSFGVSASSVASFGVLHNGRVIVLSLAGGVFRLDPR